MCGDSGPDALLAASAAYLLRSEVPAFDSEAARCAVPLSPPAAALNAGSCSDTGASCDPTARLADALGAASAGPALDGAAWPERSRSSDAAAESCAPKPPLLLSIAEDEATSALLPAAAPSARTPAPCAALSPASIDPLACVPPPSGAGAAVPANSACEAMHAAPYDGTPVSALLVAALGDAALKALVLADAVRCSLPAADVSALRAMDGSAPTVSEPEASCTSLDGAKGSMICSESACAESDRRPCCALAPALTVPLLKPWDTSFAASSSADAAPSAPSTTKLLLLGAMTLRRCTSEVAAPALLCPAPGAQPPLAMELLAAGSGGALAGAACDWVRGGCALARGATCVLELLTMEGPADVPGLLACFSGASAPTRVAPPVGCLPSRFEAGAAGVLMVCVSGRPVAGPLLLAPELLPSALSPRPLLPERCCAASAGALRMALLLLLAFAERASCSRCASCCANSGSYGDLEASSAVAAGP